MNFCYPQGSTCMETLLFCHNSPYKECLQKTGLPEIILQDREHWQIMQQPSPRPSNSVLCELYQIAVGICIGCKILNSCPFLHQNSSFGAGWCSPVTETLHSIENDRTSQYNFTKKDTWGIIWIIFFWVPRLELEKCLYNLYVNY